MLPQSLSEKVLQIISEHLKHPVSLQGSSPLSGGSINDAFRVKTSAGTYFMKFNRADAFPGMFEQEATGLELLKGAGEVRVPEVIGTGNDGKNSFIVLEYLESAPMAADFWESFGRRLAALHRHSTDKFGLDHNNYIGSLKQYNDRYGTWIDFFREERLMVQMEMAARAGLLPSRVERSFERLFARLADIFPPEPPSLIHGDLWSGNYMVDDRGEACIIDPAVYYGFREMDIGMSRLFGVFGPGFYDAYNEAWPMAPGWRERVDICNLYPLMVHVNLFGAGYLGSVERVLRAF